MTGQRRRLERWGFRAWIVGMLRFAVGIARDIGPALVVGLIILAALLLVVGGRLARDIWWPRRRPVDRRTDRR